MEGNYIQFLVLIQINWSYLKNLFQAIVLEEVEKDNR